MSERWNPESADPRRRPPRWSTAAPVAPWHRSAATALAGLVAVALYLTWLLRPERVGHPVLFGALVAAELFNVSHALGFWWTCTSRRARPPRSHHGRPSVDVLVPVYGEPVDVVEATLAAATQLQGAMVRVALLDDGGAREMEALAHRVGVRYIRRGINVGAKAGNINHALALTDAPFVAVFDCDHVPAPDFLERCLGHLDDDRVALVQTPQWYANAAENEVAAAAAAQQSLFFGPIARGKDARGAMFCCGTNMVFRRAALEEVGGFPETSVTEDFQLSVALMERGWRAVYVDEVLAQGLGPEDMASYASQQQRWARGCVSAIPGVVRAKVPVRLKLQHLLSASYFLTGWTVLLYMSLPVIRILTGAQPIAGADADQFLVNFAPYFGVALLAVAVSGCGAYTYRAFALAFASWWIHVYATVQALRRRPARFVVTPKRGTSGRQLRAVWPSLVALAALVGVAGYGLARDQSAGTLNNVAFSTVHVVVLVAGVAPALRPGAATAASTAPAGEAAAA